MGTAKVPGRDFEGVANGLIFSSIVSETDGEDGVLERLFQERAERLERLTARAQALAEASRAFSEVAHDIDAVLDVVVRKTAELVGEACTISLISDDRQTMKMVAYHHVDPVVKEATGELLADVELHVGDSIVGKVAATGRPFWVEDVSDAVLRKTVHPQFRAFLEKVTLRAMLCVPLRAHDEISGTLTITRGASGGPYTVEDKDFLEDLAARAALVIANGRMFRRLQNELQERARAEEALRRIQEELRQAQKMEAIGRMAGGIAHDFNNALSAILTTAEIARRGLAAEDPLARDLDVVCQAGQHAAALTKQLLVFSRNQAVQPTNLDLNDVVRNLQPMLRRLLPEDIEMSLELSPETAAVEANAGQLEQVIVNLSANARDAMPEGGRLTIATSSAVLPENLGREHPERQAGRQVLLAVSDTGHGMDSETLTHVFEPFFTTKKPGQGTGLGLTSVYGIVKQSGGHVSVESEPERGTTFKIYLPACAPVRRAAPRALPPRVHGEATAIILLVEDDPLVRKVVCRTLALAGHSVVEAGGAEEAEIACRRNEGRIDLLLTDVVLPGANGPEVARRLRALKPDLKVLYMSGYTGDEITRRQILAPGTLLLEKPFTLQSMTEKIREALGTP